MKRLFCTALTITTAFAVVVAAPNTAVAGTESGDQVGAAKAKKAKNSDKVTFYAGLERPEGSATKKLRKISDPDSGKYRASLTRSQVKERYGAYTEGVDALRKSAKKHDLKVTLDGTGVFAKIKGTAGKFGKWLGEPVLVVDQSQEVSEVVGYPVDAHMYFTKGKPPKKARSHVEEWFPLFQRQKVPSVAATSAQQPYDGTNKGTPHGCLKDLPPYDSPPLGEDVLNYAPNQLRTAYGIDDLPDSAKVGKATRLAIISEGGDGFSAEAARIAAECFDRTPVKYRTQGVHGLVGTLPDTQSEADLDVQVSQYVLPPGATVDVVQALPNGELSFPGYAKAFNLDRRPDVLSLSYLECEYELRQTFKHDPFAKLNQTVQEAVFVRMGLAGMTFFAATGDSGSSGCVNQGNGVGPRKASPTYPTTSRYVTAVGGSMLQVNADNERVSEYVWNNTQLNLAGYPSPYPVGGNGGTSTMYERPWWQPKSMTNSSMRTTPDLVAHAGMPAWPMFSADADSAGPTQGTSAATPFTASTFAIIDAVERINGRPPVGLVQPLLYDLVGSDDVFYDITEYNNDVYGVGCCTAGVGYDKASGLGAPHFGRIAEAIAATS